MKIRKANISDLLKIQKLVTDTIRMVYPHYYPQGAVDFFLAHHSEENISADIAQKYVYVCEDENIVGTITVKANEICRFFVAPRHQRKGYGKAMIIFAEKLISESSHEIVLDASLPAKKMYLKNGYEGIAYHEISAGSGDMLCYDVMRKKLNAEQV